MLQQHMALEAPRARGRSSTTLPKLSLSRPKVQAVEQRDQGIVHMGHTVSTSMLAKHASKRLPLGQQRMGWGF